MLPGPELEAKPLTDSRAPIVLRIAKLWPHGTAFRYDLVWYGLDPGTFDLKDYLRRKDGSSAKDLPSIRVEVKALLPQGQILPNPLESQPSPALGGYRTLLIVAGTLWVAGLAAILFVRRPKGPSPAVATPHPLT